MARAVLFDFYGTLAYWRDVHASGYGAVLASLGYPLPPGELDAYFTRYDGVEHIEHSADAAAYESWLRSRLGDLLSASGVPEADTEGVLGALRASDESELEVYPDAAPTLRAVRQAGLIVGVCSNWGWDLERSLEQVGLRDLVDVAVTSARAGARKPHPRMYSVTLDALNIPASEIVFVGDSWEPDVVGPMTAGMTAVHLWRADERLGHVAPALEAGGHRIAALDELLAILGLS